MSLRLPRLPRNVALVDKFGLPLIDFQRWWQKAVEGVENAVAAIEGSQADIDANAANLAAAEVSLASLDARLDAYDLLSLVLQDQGPAWAAATGTADRTTYATYTAPTISGPPTQAEVQAIANHVQVLSERLKALIDDLQANGALT